MKTIGFKNFRKFPDFPSMSLEGINIFVGGNNSGKSTVVKALLLVDNFLKNANKQNVFARPYFVFGGASNIGTFSRALCNRVTENEISFESTLDHYRIKLWIKSDNTQHDSSNAIISKVLIMDDYNRIEIVYDFIVNQHIKIDFFPGEAKNSMREELLMVEAEEKKIVYEIAQLESEIEEQKKLSSSRTMEVNGDLDATIERIESLKKLASRNERLKELKMRAVETRNKTYELEKLLQPIILPLSYYDNHTNVLYLKQLVLNIIASVDYLAANKKAENYSEELYKKEVIEKRLDMFRDFADGLEMAIEKNKFEYIYAHAADQIALYDSRDENDYVAKSIREFVNSQIGKNDEEWQFVKDWMKLFEIGNDFHIESYFGEAYGLSIIDEYRKQINLADKGKGSIQLMILLLRLATIIRKYNVGKDNIIVLVEEPEQNIHPDLQVLLTDLFCDVFKKWGIRFIIETHSEYLVRHAQLIVASGKYKYQQEFIDGNPFKVYYFSQDNIPYDMLLEGNGRFKNAFGDGFFNVAALEALGVSKIERERRRKEE